MKATQSEAFLWWEQRLTRKQLPLVPKEGPLRAPASLYPNGPELEELNVISAFSENLRSILAKTLNENIVTFYRPEIKECFECFISPL